MNMADRVDDGASNPVVPAAQLDTVQRTSAAPDQQKRHTQLCRSHHRYSDGAVSDGALVSLAASPRPKKNQKQRQSITLGSEAVKRQDGDMGNSTGQRPKSMSCTGPHVSATPGKEKAYAGPTFQASPAASALPMPKFSRSVPTTGARSARLACGKEDKTAVEEPFSPESEAVSPTALLREVFSSPLDMFFLADKAEKERSRTGSQTLSPEMEAIPQLAIAPRDPFERPGRSIFLNELDGDDVPSPRTLSSKANRPQLGGRAVSSPVVPPHNGPTEEERQERTDSLKNILFQAVSAVHSATPRTHSHTPPGVQSPSDSFGSTLPFSRSASDPSTPGPFGEKKQQAQQDHYSLHYGNRNLSPLFKAARSDAPLWPSSLRQQMGSDSPSHLKSGANDPQLGPKIFAPNYPNQHIDAAGPATMSQPDVKKPSASFGGIPVDSSTPPVNAPNGISGQAANTNSSSPRSVGARDVRTMENDLRRMLKLNVLG